MGLTTKKLNFVDHYIRTNNAVESVIAAGFSPKGAATAAWRVMKDPLVVEEINRRRKEYVRERGLNKETFIEFALNDYNSVDVSSANRPRFLHLAGQASGIIGSEAGNTTTLNLTLNKNTLIASTTNEQLEHLQKMLESE